MSEDEKNTNGAADESQSCCGKKEGHECCGHGKEDGHECCGHGKEDGRECCGHGKEDGHECCGHGKEDGRECCGHGKKDGHECCGHGKEDGHECCGHGKEDGHECCGGHDHDHGCGCGHDGDGHECGCGHGAKTEKANANSDSDFYDAMADYPMPKPSLVTFATTLSQQAMVAMGILPHPLAKKSVFMLNQASYLIDTIELIFEKTAGNRTEEETKTLDNILHDLRMLFIAASNEKKRRDAENKDSEKKDA